MDRLKSLGESFRRRRSSLADEQWSPEEQNSPFPIKYLGSAEVTASKGMPVCAEASSMTLSSSDSDLKGNINIHSIESLNECLVDLVDASECYANADYYKRAYDCERQAKLIALQIALRESELDQAQNEASGRHYQSTGKSITNVLNLSIHEPQELINTIIGLENFQEAYIVAEAYDYQLAWHRALFNNVILRGSMQYLEEFCRKCDLSTSIITDLVVLYKQHLSSIRNRATDGSENGASQQNQPSSSQFLTIPTPGGSKRLSASSSSSNLLLKFQPSLTNVAASFTSNSSTIKPTIVKPFKATPITNRVADGDDNPASSNASKINKDEVEVEVTRRDDNNGADHDGADGEPREEDDSSRNEDDELAKLASAMRTVLERLNNIKLRFKIYLELNFCDAKEELVGRDASIAAYLKDLKLVV